ncbi:hypothetical protein HMPREF1564_3063 [Providencia alcalifaciens R90-1475]|uniref:PheST operon leader peptide PheM n=1 Tax=Providencia alcalifaciens 205/92 TaxID=1256988 RepID=A0AAV3M309_9GAMM|nr:hypothetical protein HMPREF1564_3063 [Providencia alcalifaciens R90-1475]EUD10135.1 hypothetical protein HMPREF1563_3165 [Providencia alcalifaciens 205/92]
MFCYFFLFDVIFNRRAIFSLLSRNFLHLILPKYIMSG